MKTFKDLKFEPHNVGNGLMARMLFDNGYGVSVVRFSIGAFGGSYTDGDEWEVAVVKKTEDGSTLCYDTPITQDVIGHQTDAEVTDIMRQVQELEEK